jgi:microsomal dipeptidase-like Zn-dependent dipeptidase
MLGPLPPGVMMTGEFAASTVAVIFVSNAQSVRWFLNRYRTSMTLPRAIWVCYPTLGRSDFNRGTLQTMLAGHGLHPVTEVAIDASWTALGVRRFGPTSPPISPA